MGIFGRLAQLIKSNLNDLISRSEDPEKMLNQVILEMNTQLVEAKKQVALSIADEKRLGKQFDTEKATAEEWERKAMMAVRAGDDELAKEALLRQKEHGSLSAELEKQWQKQNAAVTNLKHALQMLNNKIEEARRKKNVLVARKKRAEAQKAIQDTMSGLAENSAFETFNRMEEKINQMEAEADAQAEVAEQYTGDALARPPAHACLASSRRRPPDRSGAHNGENRGCASELLSQTPRTAPLVRRQYRHRPALWLVSPRWKSAGPALLRLPTGVAIAEPLDSDSRSAKPFARSASTLTPARRSSSSICAGDSAPRRSISSSISCSSGLGAFLSLYALP